MAPMKKGRLIGAKHGKWKVSPSTTGEYRCSGQYRPTGVSTSCDPRYRKGSYHPPAGRVDAHPTATSVETIDEFERIIQRARARGAVVSNHLSDTAPGGSWPAEKPTC